MGSIVIKPDPDRDEYVEWSTNVDAPVGYGTRTEMLAELDGAGLDSGPCPTCGSWVSSHSLPAARLDRADKYGSSAHTAEGRWGDDEFIYEQRGYLPRRHLYQAARLLGVGRDSEVWDLLIPFEDETEVRRG